ncbi:glycosyltransferase family 4 protein [Kitasatospora sp. NPDC048365]|uniref:glycosyltransferase family 4 protein n=1 Tax=Kitasatospora sp. NPDC048365 TaxID=3364050 RepID=UPI0037152C23
MHIGFAGPISLAPLRDRLGCEPPATYSFPYTGQLVRAWLEQGHRVTVYAVSQEVTGRWVHEAGPLTLVLVPTRSRARHYLRDFFRVEREALSSAMRDRPADVVSAHWTYEFALAAAQSGLPAFVTAHDAPLRCAWEEGTAFRWLRNSLALPAVHRASALSAVSPYTARHLQRVLRAPGPVQVIPNGIEPAGLPSAPSPAPTDAPAFATVLNGWGPLKNGKAALRAFGRARAQLPGARLLMFGDGFGPGGAAEAWSRSQGLTAGVEFIGSTDHGPLLARVAAEATVLIHPSRLEACPMVLLEAMAMGVPVIAGRHSGAVPWVLGDGEAGVLVDPESREEFASAMVTLGQDTARRARLAAAGRDRVRRHFDLGTVAAAYTRWFETAA